MRFRPLSIDYHSEASQLLRERESNSGVQRPTIWLSRRQETGEENGVPDHCNDRTSSEYDCQRESIGPVACQRKRLREADLSVTDSMEDGESFTAVFDAPHSYRRWIEEWSVRTKAGLY
jgi:hypothetical protein